MAAGRRPPRHNRLTRRRDAEKTRQSNPPPTGDPQKTDPIRANRARDALVLTTVTAQSSSGRERPSPSYEKCGLDTFEAALFEQVDGNRAIRDILRTMDNGKNNEDSMSAARRFFGCTADWDHLQFEIP